MNKILLATVTSLIFLTPAVQAKDACETVLCMFGKLQGANPNECRPAVKDYFSIVKKKRGKIRWDRTANARLDFLNSCPHADSDTTKKINAKFGMKRG